MLPLAYDNSYAPEPELLTHRDDELDDFENRFDDDRRDGDDEDGAELTEEDRLARKKKIWRRVRRTGYALVAFFIIAPIVGFFIAYQVVDVPRPADIAAAQKKPVTFLYANNKEMDKSIAAGANRELIDVGDMPETVKKAAYAAEDATFETNAGFDITGILRAAWNQVTGGSGGGSTITQQYVKQATGDDDYSYVRKATELVKAYKMNNQQTKREIITAYLNTVYFGRGAYGIQAASNEFFGKDADKLSKSEAALLAGLIQSPGRSEDEEYVQRRWNFVADQMVANRWWNKSERQAATLPKRIPYESGGEGLKGRKHLQFVEDRIKDELESKNLDWDFLQRSGARITTTLNPRAQQLAVRSSREVMAANKGTPNLANAVVSADPKTGGIVAYYGGDDKAEFGFDMADTPHPPGSSFKPFVFLAALENDPSVGLDSYYDGSSGQTIGGVEVNNAEEEGTCAQCTVRQAMTESVNTVFYKMAFDTGTSKVRDAALQAGLSKKVRQPGTGAMVDSLATVDDSGRKQQVDAGIALGQYEVTPRDMAQGYATLANQGNRIPLHFVTKVTDASGENVLYTADDGGEPAFDENNQQRNQNLAGNVTESMIDVADSSGATLDDGREVAAKTGTAQLGDTGHNQAAWMVGYTPQVVTSVWVGNRDKPGPIYGNYESATGYDIYGRQEPSFIWQKYMSAVTEDMPEETFPSFDELGEDQNKSGMPIYTEEPDTEPVEPTEETDTSESSEPTEEPSEPTDPGDGGPGDGGPGDGGPGDGGPGDGGPGGGGPGDGGPGDGDPGLPIPGGDVNNNRVAARSEGTRSD